MSESAATYIRRRDGRIKFARAVHPEVIMQVAEQIFADRFRAMESEAVLKSAERIMEQRMLRDATLSSPAATHDYLKAKIGGCDAEQFVVIFLDNRHRVIACETMFTGTIDSASVYPREVVRRALHHNAAAVIFSHNHPSGSPEPSQADRDITRQLQQALKLIEVRVLDHVIVAGTQTLSLAERGWL